MDSELPKATAKDPHKIGTDVQSEVPKPLSVVDVESGPPKPGTAKGHIGSESPPEAVPTPPVEPAFIDNAVHNFDQEDALKHIGDKKTVFLGSSTFANWTKLESEFKGDDALNRGIGGSTLPELDLNLPDLVLKHRPDTVVVYAGTNDIGEDGHDGNRVFQDFKKMEHDIHAVLPNTDVYFISISLPPSRVAFKKDYELGNSLIKDYIEHTAHTQYIDVTSAMQDANHDPITRLFGDDKLHMTEEGYARWEPIIKEALHNGVDKKN